MKSKNVLTEKIKIHQQMHIEDIVEHYDFFRQQLLDYALNKLDLTRDKVTLYRALLARADNYLKENGKNLQEPLQDEPRAVFSPYAVDSDLQQQ